jgi:hypothetical protein
MPVDGGVSDFSGRVVVARSIVHQLISLQTTAGRADRPALTADTLAEKNTGIPNSRE